MKKQFYIYPASIVGAKELINKITKKLYPFEDATGEYELIRGKTNWGNEFFRINYIMNVNEEGEA